MPATTDSADLICLLDDDASIRKALVRLLNSAGFDACAFEHSTEFLAYAAASPMRLAILDVWMPGMNGLDVQARLREIAPQIPVIVMTARDERATRNLAVSTGAIAFITKPFRDDIFLAAVHAALLP